ncbi:DUF3368 domain-containing protein [Geobacillus sp. YHL]|uniref:DUF3368 domain-containing protein n=1 Tax=Geobacillus sp. YHL TaxID=2796117 RepID=UPI001EF11836|nr:DUF3368 domain-containing protein [Geobacillus sp. YHL]MCG6795642.1 DUF3368 domain-containing protein [Geobacillus sp. YHL]
MSRVTVNSTPIIGLSIVGQLTLLSELFDEVYVPEAVYQEIVHNHAPRHYGKEELKRLVSEGVFRLYHVKNRSLVESLYGKFHAGELEVIIGAKELGAQVVVIDEHAARSLSKQFLLRPIGTIGVLILGKKNRKIAEVKPLLDTLLENGFYLSQRLYREALSLAEEIP